MRPFRILQYDPNTHSFFDDTSAMFSGQVPSLANPRNVTIANFNGNGPGFIIAEQGLDASPWLGDTDTLLLSNQFGQLDQRFRSSNHIRPPCRAYRPRCERRAPD